MYNKQQKESMNVFAMIIMLPLLIVMSPVLIAMAFCGINDQSFFDSFFK